MYDLGYLQGTWFPTDQSAPPCDANNSLGIARGATDATIVWASQAGKTYTIKFKSDLSAGWQPH